MCFLMEEVVVTQELRHLAFFSLFFFFFLLRIFTITCVDSNTRKCKKGHLVRGRGQIPELVILSLVFVFLLPTRNLASDVQQSCTWSLENRPFSTSL